MESKAKYSLPSSAHKVFQVLRSLSFTTRPVCKRLPTLGNFWLLRWSVRVIRTVARPTEALPLPVVRETARCGWRGDAELNHLASRRTQPHSSPSRKRTAAGAGWNSNASETGDSRARSECARKWWFASFWDQSASRTASSWTAVGSASSFDFICLPHMSSNGFFQVVLGGINRGGGGGGGGKKPEKLDKRLAMTIRWQLRSTVLLALIGTAALPRRALVDSTAVSKDVPLHAPAKSSEISPMRTGRRCRSWGWTVSPTGRKWEQGPQWVSPQWHSSGWQSRNNGFNTVSLRFEERVAKERLT